MYENQSGEFVCECGSEAIFFDSLELSRKRWFL